MSDLVILTEAGGAVGYGHLMRCIAIASNLDAIIYVHTDGDYPDSQYSKSCNWRTDLDKLSKLLPLSSSILVDSYLASIDIYENLSNHFDYVSVLDDYNRIRYPVDMVINPGVNLPEYSCQDAKIVAGNKYVVLRKEIIEHPKKTDYSSFDNLLITFGGCNTSSIFEWLIPICCQGSFNRITCVTGNNETCRSLSSRFDNTNINWFGQIDASKMAELMCEADICISAGGQTLHELAFLGVPTIAIETGEDQKYIINQYISSEFILKYLTLKKNNLSHRIQLLLNDYSSKELRQRLTTNSKQMVDGLGAKRIAELLLLRKPGLNI